MACWHVHRGKLESDMARWHVHRGKLESEMVIWHVQQGKLESRMVILPDQMGKLESAMAVGHAKIDSERLTCPFFSTFVLRVTAYFGERGHSNRHGGQLGSHGA